MLACTKIGVIGTEGDCAVMRSLESEEDEGGVRNRGISAI